MTTEFESATGTIAAPPTAPERTRTRTRNEAFAWPPAVLLALLLLAGAAVAAVLLFVAAHGLNRAALETENQVAHAILDEHLDDQAQVTLDRAWPQAPDGAPLDRDWTDDLGAVFSRTFGVDAAYVIDAAGRTRFASRHGAPQGPDAAPRPQPGLDRLIARTGVEPDGRPRPAVGVMLLDGAPHIVAAAPLRPAAAGDPSPGVLVTTQPIDRGFLDRHARRFLLPDLRFEPGAEARGAPLAAPDGTRIGALAWTGARPGDALTGWLLPALLVAGGLIGALAWRIAAAWRGEQRRAALVRNRLSAVLEGAADAIVLFDAAGRVADVNRAAERLFGRTEEDALGQPLGALLRAADGGEPTLDRLTGAEAAGSDLLAERGGAAIPVEVRVSRIVWPGAPLYSAVVRDITPRKELENGLRAAKEAAEVASRAKSQFVAAMSHELRTPLNAIIGFSEIIKEQALGPLGDPHYASYAGDIHEGATHLLAVINDILDIAKVESGEMALSERPVAPGALVTACLRLMRDRAERAGVTLVDAVDDATPAVLADERLVKQMLVNLLSNAVKFTPPGGTVTVRAAPTPDGGLAISVADTGEGMQPAVLERVFFPFVQADDRLSRGHEGTGLGLPLTKALIERHGGRVALESAPGRGTVATLLLPPGRVLGRDGAAVR